MKQGICHIFVTTILTTAKKPLCNLFNGHLLGFSVLCAPGLLLSTPSRVNTRSRLRLPCTIPSVTLLNQPGWRSLQGWKPAILGSVCSRSWMSQICTQHKLPFISLNGDGYRNTICVHFPQLRKQGLMSHRAQIVNDDRPLLTLQGGYAW